MASAERPILFHYPPSIFSHRVLWYLWLRGIPYDESITPAYLPRPDFEALDINYRRIPVLAIGKDIYCDSRLIIQKLEKLYPGSTLTPTTPFEAGIRKLLESWTIDGGLFMRSVALIPYWTSTGLLQDQNFLDDRQKLNGGRRMTAESMEAGRPDGLIHMRQAFDTMESTFLADGRKWILGTETPTTADIDGAWVFEWLTVDNWMKECLPKDYISEEVFPKTYAWVHRLMDAANTARKRGPKPTKLQGTKLHEHITSSKAEVESLTVLVNDPLKLCKGDTVEVYASDYGFTHRDRGPLIGLTTDQVTIMNAKGLALHFPRWNYKIEKVRPASALPAAVATPPKTIPKMKLFYHHGSPFVRKVFMLALELSLGANIALEKVVVCPIQYQGWSDNNEDVASYNPMAKIPCLVPEDVPDGIFDSRVICQYLERVAGLNEQKDARYWRLQSLHAASDGIMDAGVLIAYELRIRKERGLKFDEWIAGQRLKISRALDHLNQAAQIGLLLGPPCQGPASAAEIAAVCAVFFSGSMGTKWAEGRSSLVEWYKKWEQRQSFIDTPPGEEWKAGGGHTSLTSSSATKKWPKL